MRFVAGFEGVFPGEPVIGAIRALPVVDLGELKLGVASIVLLLQFTHSFRFIILQKTGNKAKALCQMQ